MNRNQTWTQGGVESGQLVEDVLVPIPQAELDLMAAAERLRNARGKPINGAKLADLMADLLLVMKPG